MTTVIPRNRHRRPGLAMALSATPLLLLAGCATPAGEQNDATALTLPGADVSVACAPLTPDTMAAANAAFRGTVMTIEDDQVSLRVDDEFAGDLEDVVIVPQQSADQPSELSIGTFTIGAEYLIAANDGVILTCGQSGPATPELAALYDSAF